MKSITSTNGSRPVEVAAIEVDDVGDALEGEEGDTDRQHDLPVRHLGAETGVAQQPVEVLDEEVPVFEVAEQAEIEGNADADDQLAPSGSALAAISQPAAQLTQTLASNSSVNLVLHAA